MSWFGLNCVCWPYLGSGFSFHHLLSLISVVALPTFSSFVNATLMAMAMSMATRWMGCSYDNMDRCVDEIEEVGNDETLTFSVPP